MNGNFTLFSFKKELTTLLIYFLILLTLPLIATVVVTNTGIPLLSSKLAAGNNTNHTVTLYYPNGKIYQEIKIESFWPVNGIVTLEFGQNDLPYQPLHSGIDIAAKVGTPITAAITGIVTYADEISWGYGKHVKVDNGNGIQTLYGHLSQIAVRKGDKVIQGKTLIGYIGSTGWSTGPHLHFEVDVFLVPINPRTFIQGNP